MTNAPQGWSFIACPNQVVPVLDIGQDPGNSIISIFGWNGAIYVQVNLQTGQLEPGEGYWVNLSQQAALTIPV